MGFFWGCWATSIKNFFSLNWLFHAIFGIWGVFLAYRNLHEVGGQKKLCLCKTLIDFEQILWNKVFCRLFSLIVIEVMTHQDICQILMRYLPKVNTFSSCKMFFNKMDKCAICCCCDPQKTYFHVKLLRHVENDTRGAMLDSEECHHQWNIWWVSTIL